MAESSARAARNWRWNWKRRVMARWKPRRDRLHRSKENEGNSKVITATQQLEPYLESFTEFEKLAAGHDLPWLRELRRNAFARFCEVGFPTTHDEDWRFTNVSSIAQTPYRIARNRRARLLQKELKPYRVAGAGCQLVFVDGRFAREQ